MNGNATHGSKKEIVDGGMKNREGFIIEKKLKRTIKLMKENKATDESGMIAEHIKALGDQDLNNLMRLFVAFIDMEKAYDRVNRKKLFEVMRGYGVHNFLVDVIERIYNGSMVKFELESIMTAWCKSDSGVIHGCPLSPLLFNIYVRELIEEYKYLGVTVKAGLNGRFKSMGDRMVDANGVLGMVKYTAARSGSKYVVGREGWKSMVQW